MQTKQKGKNLATLPFFLEHKTGLALAQSASDGRDPLSTSPAPERGALRSRASNPVPPPKNKKENLAILLSFATLASLERKTGLTLAHSASDGRDPLLTPPAPERGALRSRGQAPGMSASTTKGEPNRFSLCCWSGKRDSDPRPQPWQGCALPTELFPHDVSETCASGLQI